MSSGLERVVVIGAGTMGHGIAQVAAMSGYSVTVVDVSEEILGRALEKIRWSLGKFAERGRIRPEEVEKVMGRIRTTTSLESACADADVVIEAVFEDLQVKLDTWRRASRAARRARLLGTNTSSIPIDELQAAVERPERFLGIHFFNPPQLMQLVEVIIGSRTSEETKRLATEFARSLGKTVVTVNRDVPGFIVNRVLTRFFEVACHLVEKGRYTPVQIDSALKYRAGFPMGAFELADYVGIDVAYNVSKVIAERDRTFRPIELLRRYVERGELGAKTGRGFYEWPAGARPSIPQDAGRDVDIWYMIVPGMNEAARLVEQGVASHEDVETAMKLGLNLPRGVFGYASELTPEKVNSVLSELRAELGEGYAPSSYLLSLVSQPRPAAASFEEIEVRREPPIGWIVLNRPHRLNAISPKMIEELEVALKDLSEDRSVRVIVLTGAGGRAFSAGADITAFSEILATESKVPMAHRFSLRFNELLRKIERSPKPVIAAIDGFALGGGLELALACDFRIATERSEVGQPEIRLGLIPGGGATQRLTRLIGPSKAKLVIFLGDRIKAEEALRLGIIDKVVPPEGFEREVREFAMRLAEMPPIALAAAKDAINAALEVPIDEGLRHESSLFAHLFATKDLMEGISAFFSKRKPEFKGE
ncbi:MAG: 3-hydroxyacyl-CoA dehydrogenase/enoyl-CoA hydratase family protein [Aigarchaeota archaeon]|nr:3-hydroxyacyl-CoA dehydrogenase/enoyl-CoA hydratase family protein [Candidatus Calditenuis fumarioli]